MVIIDKYCDFFSGIHDLHNRFFLGINSGKDLFSLPELEISPDRISEKEIFILFLKKKPEY
jgi:hypothetical protein